MSQAAPMAPQSPPSGDPRPLLLFDGECGLCTASVRFILDRDRRGELWFASLQSDLGRRVLRDQGMDPEELSTLVLVESTEGGDSTFSRSTAALRVARDHLRAPWRLAGVFLVLPRFLRDPFYRLVARYRLRLFGTADACEIPAPGMAERFVG